MKGGVMLIDSIYLIFLQSIPIVLKKFKIFITLNIIILTIYTIMYDQ
jgi:hypothetical protein